MHVFFYIYVAVGESQSASEELEPRNSALNDDNDQSDQIVLPKLGMKFNNADDLFEFYSSYAFKTGFSCKKRTCKRDHDGALNFVTYSCTKEGKNRSVSDSPLNLPPTQRTNCKAKISARLCEDEKWMISVVTLEHNHLNSPSKSRHLRGHKRIDTATKKKVLVNDKAGIRMCNIFGALA
ncbi:hypothetical protein MKW92_037247, partial [Papaver armeniacum]